MISLRGPPPPGSARASECLPRSSERGGVDPRSEIKRSRKPLWRPGAKTPAAPADSLDRLARTAASNKPSNSSLDLAAVGWAVPTTAIGSVVPANSSLAGSDDDDELSELLSEFAQLSELLSEFALEVDQIWRSSE